jgi:lysophospholipase L1-like esterase
MKPLSLLLLLALFLPFTSQAEKGVTLPGEASKKTKKSNPAFAKTEDDPALPRVLIIGDSISIGYTAAVREALQGKANLHRVPGNAGHTAMGLSGLPKWLDEKNGEWDLIHFNWGLWDLCYRNPESKTQGNRDKVDGTLTHTPDEYAANLEKIVQELKKTGAVLVFATTTPVPEEEAGRKVGDDAIYNEAALEVMKRHGIAVDDLHAVMAGKMAQYAKGPGDVHFTPEGYAILANAVAESVEGELP